MINVTITLDEQAASIYEAIEALWRRETAVPEAVTVAMACLRAVELAAIWEKGTGARLLEVWRERAFEVVLDGVWFTGVFDRVLVERDASGRASPLDPRCQHGRANCRHAGGGHAGIVGIGRGDRVRTRGGE